MGVINFIGHGTNIVGSLGGASLVQDMPSAMQLNGTNAYASGSTTMSTVTGTTATIAMWVYYTGSQTNQGEKVLFSDSSSETRKILMQTRNYSSHGTSFRFGYVDSAGGGLSAKDTGGSAGVLTSGTWQHFAIVTDGNNVSLHVDGVLYSDGTYASAGTHSYAIANPHLGRAAFSDGRYFPGYIRDVQVYNVSSSATQLGQIMKGELPHGTPIHWWTCDDGATNDDGSATDSDLTLTNTVQDKSKYHLYQVGSGSIGDDDSQITAHVSGGTWDLRDKTTYLDFNGTASYTDLGAVTTFDGKSVGSVSAWIKLDSLGSSRTIITRYDSSDSNRQFNFLIDSTNKVKFIVQNDKSSYNSDHDAVGATSLVAGQWNHVVGTFSTTNGQKVYLNGQLDGTAATTIEDALDTVSQNAYIGKLEQGGTSSNYFDGIIKDVGMYETELTSTQIKLLYEGKWVGNPAHLWKLNEGTGNGEDSGQGSTTAQTQSTTWVNPSYGITSSGSGDDVDILYLLSGNTLSAPKAELVCRAIKNTPNWRLEGKYIHNSGTFEFKNATTNDWYPANKSDNTNTFYKVKQNGTKPQWHKGNWTIEHSLNLQANIRSYAHAGHTEGYTLTLGTTGSVGYISGSAYIQAMTNTNGGSLVKSASENYPAILSGTHSDYGSTLGLYRSIQVSGVHIYGTMKTGNNAFENGSKLTILGNTKWFDKTGGGAEIKIPLTDSASNDTGQTLDVSGASVHIKIPMYISGNMIAKDAALFINKFGQTLNRETIHNDNTKIIYSHQTANNDTFIMPAISGQQMMNSNYRQYTNAEYDIKGDLIVAHTNTTGFRLNHNFSCRNIYVGDDANSVFDQNDKTLTVSGTKLSAVGGFIGACQGMFDNTASQRITISDNLDEMATSNNFTVEAWFEASDDANYRGIFSRGSSWGTGNIYMYQNSDGYVQVSAHDLGKTLTSQTIGLADGKWHHAAATYDQTSFKLYIDGILEAESAHTNAINTQTGGSFIGSRGTSDYFNGSLVRVSAWDTALTQSQIQQMMFMDYLSVSSSAIDHTKCVSWFQFDGKTNNTTVYNLAANGTDGTAATTALWDVPNGYSNWIKGTGSTAQLYLTSPLDIDVWGKNWRIGAISGGATAGKKMKITRWDGYEQTIQFYGAWKWGPGTIEQRNYATYGDNSTPWCTAQAGGYVEEISGTPFGDASNGLSSYWQSSTPTKPMTIKNMLPTDSANLGGDLTIVGTMMPSLSSKSKYIDTHGYDMMLKQWKSYNNTVGELRLGAGSTVYWVNDNTGFAEGVSDKSLIQIVASGEACAIFPGEDGRGGIHDEIDLPAGVLESLPQSTLSISMWVNIKDDDLGTYSGFFGGTPGKQFSMWRQSANRLMFAIGGSSEQFSIYPTVDSGVWYHIGMTYDGTTVKGYFNGTQTGSRAYAGSWTPSVSVIGNYAPGGGNTLDGKIADVRIFPTTLSDANFATLASENPAISVSGAYADPTNSLGAIAWYKLGATTSGTLDVSNFGTSGATFNGSIDGVVKSGFTRMLPSGSTNAWEFNNGTGDKMLQNFYLSGSSGDILVSNSGTANAAGAYYPGSLTTKGQVRFD